MASFACVCDDRNKIDPRRYSQCRSFRMARPPRADGSGPKQQVKLCGVVRGE